MEQKGYSASRVARHEAEKSSYGGVKKWVVISAPHPRGQGAAAATSVRATAKVLGGRTLRAGPLKDVRRMEWRRWCAVVRRQWCEARRCYMAPPRAAASSKLANGRVPVEAGREPTHVQHTPQYHMATGKRKRRTLTPSCRNWTPRVGATPTPEKKAA